MDTQTGAYQEVAQDGQHDMTSVLFDTEQGLPELASWEKQRLTHMPLVDDIRQDIAYRAHQIPDGILDELHRTVTKDIWVVGFMFDCKSHQYYLYHRTAHKLTFLFSTRPSLDTYRLASMQPISYTARDGVIIEGYLTRFGTAKQPLVLCVHGGPIQRDTWSFNGFTQFFANRGIACLQVNYRGSKGYGEAQCKMTLPMRYSGLSHKGLLIPQKQLSLVAHMADTLLLPVLHLHLSCSGARLMPAARATSLRFSNLFPYIGLWLRQKN
jgi:hypothetical protein